MSERNRGGEGRGERRREDKTAPRTDAFARSDEESFERAFGIAPDRMRAGVISDEDLLPLKSTEWVDQIVEDPDKERGFLLHNPTYGWRRWGAENKAHFLRLSMRAFTKLGIPDHKAQALFGILLSGDGISRDASLHLGQFAVSRVEVTPEPKGLRVVLVGESQGDVRNEREVKNTQPKRQEVFISSQQLAEVAFDGVTTFGSRGRHTVINRKRVAEFGLPDAKRADMREGSVTYNHELNRIFLRRSRNGTEVPVYSFPSDQFFTPAEQTRLTKMALEGDELWAEGKRDQARDVFTRHQKEFERVLDLKRQGFEITDAVDAKDGEKYSSEALSRIFQEWNEGADRVADAHASVEKAVAEKFDEAREEWVRSRLNLLERDLDQVLRKSRTGVWQRIKRFFSQGPKLPSKEECLENLGQQLRGLAKGMLPDKHALQLESVERVKHIAGGDISWIVISAEVRTNLRHSVSNTELSIPGSQETLFVSLEHPQFVWKKVTARISPFDGASASGA